MPGLMKRCVFVPWEQPGNLPCVQAAATYCGRQEGGRQENNMDRSHGVCTSRCPVPSAHSGPDDVAHEGLVCRRPAVVFPVLADAVHIKPVRRSGGDQNSVGWPNGFRLWRYPYACPQAGRRLVTGRLDVLPPATARALPTCTLSHAAPRQQQCPASSDPRTPTSATS